MVKATTAVMGVRIKDFLNASLLSIDSTHIFHL